MDARPVARGLLLVAVAVIAVGGLVAMPAAAQSDDRFEPNDHSGDAAEIEPGQYDDLRMAEDDWADFYAVELEEGENLSAAIEFDHDASDLELVVNGPNQWYEDYSFSDTDGESVETVADEAGTYHVVVYGFAPGAADYDLSVETDSDDAEKRYAPGVYENQTVSADSPATFQLESIDADQQVAVAAWAANHTENVDVRVNGPEFFLTDGDTPGPWSGLGFVTDQETALEVVVNTDSTEPVQYDLYVDTGSADEFDPNEGPEDAVAIEAGTHENLSLVGPADTDYYTVDLAEGERVSFETTPVDGKPVDLWVTGPDDEQTHVSESHPYGEGEFVDFTAETNGTYTFHAYNENVSSHDGSTYDLEIEISDPVEPAPTYDDGVYENQTVTSNSTATYQLESLEDGELLSVATQLDDPHSDLSLRLMAPTEFQTSTDGERWRSIETIADGQGAYELEVSTTDDEPVEFDLEVATGQPDRFDPNDDHASATALEPGSYEGLSLVGEAEHDSYAIDLEAGEQLEADFESSDVWNTTITAQSAETDQFASESYDDGSKSVTLTANTTGTYYLDVDSDAPHEIEYGLDVSVEESGDESANDSQGKHANETVAPDDPQRYTIDVEQGDLIAAGLRFDEHAPGVTARIVDPSGETVSERDAGNWATTEHVASETGTYEVVVTTDGNTSMEYDLYLDSGTPDEFDPNRDEDAAAQVQPGTYEDLSIVGTGDVDYYAVDLDAGETLTATMTSEDAPGRTNVFATGPGDTFEVGEATSEGSQITITADADGTYYLDAYGDTGSSFEYDLDVTVDES